MAESRRTEVERWLQQASDAEFPATRDDIVVALEHAGAPEGVVAAVRVIPPNTYSEPDQVAAAADAVPHVDPDTASDAVQDRARGRVAEGHWDDDLPPPRDEP